LNFLNFLSNLHAIFFFIKKKLLFLLKSVPNFEKFTYLEGHRYLTFKSFFNWFFAWKFWVLRLHVYLLDLPTEINMEKVERIWFLLYLQQTIFDCLIDWLVFNTNFNQLDLHKPSKSLLLGFPIFWLWVYRPFNKGRHQGLLPV
jgi:hypothetical protein